MTRRVLARKLEVVPPVECREKERVREGVGEALMRCTRPAEYSVPVMLRPSRACLAGLGPDAEAAAAGGARQRS